MRERRQEAGIDRYRGREMQTVREMLVRLLAIDTNQKQYAEDLHARLSQIEVNDTQARADIDRLAKASADLASITDTLKTAIAALVKADAVHDAAIGKNASAITALQATATDLAAGIKAVPRFVFVGMASVVYGDVLVVALAPRSRLVTVKGVKKDELLICRPTTAMPASYGFDSARASADDQVEFVFTTPAVTAVSLVTIQMAVYAMRMG